MRDDKQFHPRLLWHLLLIGFVILLLFPIVFAVSNSFKSLQESYNNLLGLIPAQPTFNNYVTVFTTLPMVQIILNTFIIATVVTLFKLVTSYLAAYAFSFFQFRGKIVLYFIFVTTIFVPFTVTMIPNYLIISKIGLLDSIYGVMLPQLCDATGIFLITQAMRGVPRSLIEVSRVDHVSDLGILRDIVFPLTRPAVVCMGIMFFINSWNEYVWPTLILKDRMNFTLPLILQMFISSEGGTNFPIAMAISMVTILIPLILYIFFQRYILNTFSQSGIK
ncbi:carbohydrate ABC transporter permease [Sporolactobacillus sp. THM19-2]|jgi:sn-glycerol 3-phosphate transport system permease protein|uniref:carbohydrate ABC transporter permease n=1 Tax=Sporolactobacillus sp. THM19-2 TaxID=2511171 RepID=UPI0010206FA9|nr:carbohydrate ABC transporter permease [Sporolactobacillus sp. THM19-2]RYL92415.1 carbohydrate ABC transporter permease [Sporolactobacillus sp. THM19-2]